MPGCQQMLSHNSHALSSRHGIKMREEMGTLEAREQSPESPRSAKAAVDHSPTGLPGRKDINNNTNKNL